MLCVYCVAALLVASVHSSAANVIGSGVLWLQVW